MYWSNRVGQVLLAGGALLWTAGCGGPSRQDRAMAEKDSMIRRQQTEMAEAQEREQENIKQKQLILEQNKALAEQSLRLAAQNGELASSTSAKMDTLSLQIADLEKKLAANKGGDVQVVNGGSKEPGAIVIRVANTFLFDTGKADLKPSAHQTLEQVAQTLKKQYADHYIRIEGHTDSTPVVQNKAKYADNMALSQARAKVVFDHLITKCGMPANRMYTAGYANHQPVAWPEKTAADRAKNRRVDIVILPNVKVEKQSLASTK